MVQEIGHAAITASEMEGQARTHNRPTQARAVNYRRIDFFDRCLVVCHHMQRFAPHRFLQPVGDETGHFALQFYCRYGLAMG